MPVFNPYQGWPDVLRNEIIVGIDRGAKRSWFIDAYRGCLASSLMSVDKLRTTFLCHQKGDTICLYLFNIETG